MKQKFKVAILSAALGFLVIPYTGMQARAANVVGTAGSITFFDDGQSISMTDSSGTLYQKSVSPTSLWFADVGDYATLEEGTANAQAVLDSFGLYAGSYVQGVYGLIQGSPRISFRTAGLYAAYQNEQVFNSVYIPEMQGYVTDGMTKSESLMGASKYLASKVVYNYAEQDYLNGNRSSVFSCKNDPLGSGTGVCHDYATAFVALVHEIPFNENGVVDWENGTKGVLRANFINAPNHAFNAVTYDGIAHYYDVTWYDTGTRSERWLDMGPAEMSYPSHQIISIQ